MTREVGRSPRGKAPPAGKATQSSRSKGTAGIEGEPSSETPGRAGANRRKPTGAQQEGTKVRRVLGDDALLAVRGAYFDQASQFTPMLAVSTRVGLFVVSTSDAHIGRSLFVKQGRGELKSLARGVAILEARKVAERARAGTFVDVGANIGTSTVPAVLAHGFAQGLALEPEPRNLQLLRINIAVNGLDDRVQTLQLAASDAPGNAKLLVAETRSGVHEIAVDRNAEGEGHLIDVELVTVDSLVDKGLVSDDGTGMLWIDCEGHDAHVLAGATRLLAKGVPVILEISPAKLEKQGGKDLLIETANAHYSSFIDLRRTRGEVGSRKDLDYRPVRISRLADLVGKYESAISAHHTELMLLRDD